MLGRPEQRTEHQNMSERQNKEEPKRIEADLRSSCTQAASVGQQGVGAAKNAKLAAEAIGASHARQLAGATSQSEFMRRRAGEIADSATRALASGGRSAAREQVKGHFVEAMTIKQYNAAGTLVGKELVKPNSPTHAAYDAMRIMTENGKGKFAGAVQIKTSAEGIEKAISQIEKVKPGSASRATLITSDDQVAEATRKAAGRIRVRGNGVTREHATKRFDQGVNGLADRGMAATSHVRALGKAGAIGAAAGVIIGTASEGRRLHRGEISAQDFAVNRGIDAVEGAGGAVLGTAAASATGAVTTMAIGTTAGASFAASAGAAGTALLGTVGGMGTGGAAVAGALGAVTAPVALPIVAGVVASAAVGFGVSKVGKHVRDRVKESRRLADEPAAERHEPSADSVDHDCFDVACIVQSVERTFA